MITRSAAPPSPSACTLGSLSVAVWSSPPAARACPEGVDPTKRGRLCGPRRDHRPASGLPSVEGDDDEEAKRFDLLILRAQLCVLNHEPAIREQEVFLEALAALEQMLIDSGEFDREELDHAMAIAGGDLGVFVRSLVGLDRGAVNEVLSGFLRCTTLTASQLEFVDMLVEYLTQHGCSPRRSCSSHRSPRSPRSARM